MDLESYFTLVTPHILLENLIKVTLGSYQLKLAMGYITDIQQRKVKQNNAYQDFEDYHNMSQEVPQDYDACYFTQNVPSPNWDPNKFGAFQPCTVLQIRNLPSRMLV